MKSPELVKKAGRMTLLDKGCEFTGKLSFEGTVRIEGKFTGEIYTEDTLIIGDGAHVEGEIYVADVEVGGHFKGTIKAKNLITCHKTGFVEGTLIAPRLLVEDGAVLEAQCQMKGAREASQSPQIAALPIAH